MGNHYHDNCGLWRLLSNFPGRPTRGRYVSELLLSINFVPFFLRVFDRVVSLAIPITVVQPCNHSLSVSPRLTVSHTLARSVALCRCLFQRPGSCNANNTSPGACAICGLLVIALPVPIFVNNFTALYEAYQAREARRLAILKRAVGDRFILGCYYGL